MTGRNYRPADAEGMGNEVARVRHDWDGSESLSATIVSTISDIVDRDPLELDPLEHTVNTDALDTLFDSRQNGVPRDGGLVSFAYEGYLVTVHADGEVVVRRPGPTD